MATNETCQTSSTETQRRLLTVIEVAEILGVRPETVRVYFTKGLPFVRLSSRQLRVDSRDLDRWLEHKRRVNP